MKSFDKTTWRSWYQECKRWTVLKWSSLILIVGSTLYGIGAIQNPELFENYAGYERLTAVLSYQWVGLIFILLCFLKILGLALNNSFMKKLAVTPLTTMWSLVLMSLLLSHTPNTIYILPLVMIATAIEVNIKE